MIGLGNKFSLFVSSAFYAATLKPLSPTYVQRVGALSWLPTAYVLLNAEIGSERDVLQTIKGIEGVQEAFRLWGVYDVIARVKADNMDKLTQIVNEKLQIGKVHTKLTVVLMDT
jgi:DNA-binding Lrp family transcriptional regulator